MGARFKVIDGKKMNKTHEVSLKIHNQVTKQIFIRMRAPNESRSGAIILEWRCRDGDAAEQL